MTTVAHLTSVHQRHDTRIFLKQCRSLAAAGYNVHLVVADGLGNALDDGVAITDTGKSSGRLARMIGAANRVFKAALGLNADVYHLHDPELLTYAIALKRRGKHVIFDAHEDLPQQILSKAYLPLPVRKPTAWFSSLVQKSICRRIDFVVAATPVIAASFNNEGIVSTAICNYPMLGELETAIDGQRRESEVCYIGGLSEVRGIRQIVSALDYVQSPVRLNLAGAFSEQRLEKELKESTAWQRVNQLGFVARDQVRAVLQRSAAGLVTLLPTQAYRDSLPVKMFEYMSAGLPVIASDFPLWREIVAGNDCGLLVDPENPQAIADAIDKLIGDPAMARRMGENGGRAVKEKYNWSIEEKKLLALYDQLVGSPHAVQRSTGA